MCAYVPNSGSVVAFQGNPSVLQALVTVTNPTSTVSVVFPTNQNVSGSVVAFQGGAPWAQTNVGSVITVGQGSVAMVIIGGSILTSATANQSVSGTVGASVIGHAPVVIVGGSIVTTSTANQSVSGTVGASVIGTVPVVQSGTVITSLVSTVPSSVIVGASVFGRAPISVVDWAGAGLPPVGNGTTSASTPRVTIASDSAMPGSVVGFQGTNPWVIGSIVGTYAEDATHTTADKGLFVLGVRNDNVASFVSANLEYGPHATDAAGRTLIRPFAPEEARIEGYASVVSGSVTTLVAAAGAGLRNYITDIVLVNTGAATTLVTFRSGGGTSVLGYGIAPAGGGSNMIGWNVPIRTVANETFDFQATTSTSILFAKVSGFKAP